MGQIVVDDQTIWMFGSSIIKHAQVESVLRPGGSNLNLERINISLWGQGYRRLQLIRAIQKLKMLKHVGPSPKAMFLHCGGNDMVSSQFEKSGLQLSNYLNTLVSNFQMCI